MVSLFFDSGNEFGKWIWLAVCFPHPLCLAAPVHCPLAVALCWHGVPPPLLSHNDAMLRNLPRFVHSTAAHPAWCSLIPSASARSQRFLFFFVFFVCFFACFAQGVTLPGFRVSLLRHLSLFITKSVLNELKCILFKTWKKGQEDAFF